MISEEMYGEAFAEQEFPEWDPIDYASPTYQAFPNTMLLDQPGEELPQLADPDYLPVGIGGEWNNADDSSVSDWLMPEDGGPGDLPGAPYSAVQVWQTTTWNPGSPGALRPPDAPLPVLANAAALGYSTPGELAALDRWPARIMPEFWHEEWWQEPAIDGRHLMFPRQSYPIGDGAMGAQTSQVSVTGIVPGPLTSEAGLLSGAPEDYLSLWTHAA